MKMPLVLAVLIALPLGSSAANDRFVCNMRALTKPERTRYQVVAEKLLQAVDEKRELADGFAFRLPARELMTAAEWVSLERKCCPFFTFGLDQTRDGGPLWLRVTGAEGVKRFIRAEFGF